METTNPQQESNDYSFSRILHIIFDIVLKICLIILFLFLFIDYSFQSYKFGIDFQNTQKAVFIPILLAVIVLVNYFSSIEIGNYLKLNKEVKEVKEEGKSIKEATESNRSAIALIQSNMQYLANNIQASSSAIASQTGQKNIVSIGEPLQARVTASVNNPPLIEEEKQKVKTETIRFEEPDWEKIKEFAIKKKLSEFNIPSERLKLNYQLIPQDIQTGDPFCIRKVKVDGSIEYSHDGQTTNLFIVVRNINDIDSDKYDYINIILDKIYFNYARFSKSVKLLLLLLKTPINNSTDEEVHREFNNVFAPALNSGVLEVSTLEVGRQDFEGLDILIDESAEELNATEQD
jgi:hypothetical protein